MPTTFTLYKNGEAVDRVTLPAGALDMVVVKGDGVPLAKGEGIEARSPEGSTPDVVQPRPVRISASLIAESSKDVGVFLRRALGGLRRVK